ncbi:MAG: hypothetical protein KC708_11065 [Anaerolineae bacterium]|nr:hypothetical protein [Anaerolineae bacterium]
MTQLPVRQIVLYKHGVGFFTREGKLSGNNLGLTFKHGDINDILKSLVVVDRAGGQIRGIHYQTPLNPEDRLANTSIHLRDDNSLPDLIRDLRGRQVTIRLGGDNRSAEMATGRIIGLTDNNQPEARSVSILTTNNSVRVLSLDSIKEIKINDELAEHDLTYFLDTIMSEEQRRTITVRMSEGDHDLVIHYVAPSPTWRVSYRVVADPNESGMAGKALLQGWGLFDNHLSEDLENIAVTLVAGQPISFMYDLFASRIPIRPMIEDESRVAPGPIEFEQGFAAGAAMDSLYAVEMEDMPSPQVIPSQRLTRAITTAKPSAKSIRESVQTSTETKDTGETFQYIVTEPVTVRRGESALVPILNKDIEYERELLYNAQKLPNHPVAALKFTNSTGLTLERGPVTIIEDGDYKGEAIVPFTRNHSNIYLPYAVELGISIREDRSYKRTLAGLAFKDEYAIFDEYETETTAYSIDNKTERDVVITIETAKRTDWEIVGTNKPTDETLNMNRWQAKAPSTSQALFTRQERRRISRSEHLKSISHKQVKQFLADKYLDEGTFEQLNTILEAYDYIEQVHKANAKLIEERQALYKEQEQLRQNMGALTTTGREGELRSQILDQLAASQDRITSIGTTLDENDSKINKAQLRIRQLIAQLPQQTNS